MTEDQPAPKEQKKSAWKLARKPLAAFVSAVILIVITAVVNKYVSSDKPKSEPQQQTVTGAVTGNQNVVGNNNTVVLPPELEKKELPPKSKSRAKLNVALRFVFPKRPALVIVNESDGVARDIKWSVALWNSDDPNTQDPLQIPVTAFDWIKGHGEGGPNNLFDTPYVKPHISDGNKLIGTAMVDCPECAKPRVYVLYFELGTGGWFSELKNEKTLFIPAKNDREGRAAFYQELLKLVPDDKRILIGLK